MPNRELRATPHLTAQALRLVKIVPRVGAIGRGESPEYAQLNVEFHLEIGRHSGNTVMTSLLQVLLVYNRPRLDRADWSDNRRALMNEQHVRIYLALAAGDADKAQSEVRSHNRASYNSLLDEMRKPPQMNGGI